MNKLILICVLIVQQNTAKILMPDSLIIDISYLEQCDTKITYPITVSNVAVNLVKGKLAVTGTLFTSVDLTAPIQATVKIEKDELGAWIEIPCRHEIGTCDYDDLCVHSIPTNTTCPDTFINNNIPCRCPIPKGNYTIPSSLELIQLNLHDYSSIYSGKYWAKIEVNHNQKTLSCYEIYFTIEDIDSSLENTYTDLTDDIRPFVVFI